MQRGIAANETLSCLINAEQRFFAPGCTLKLSEGVKNTNAKPNPDQQNETL